MDRLEWTAWPLRDDWPRSGVLLAIIALVSIGVAVSFEGVTWGVFSLAVLALSVLRYLLPTRYTFDDEGVCARFAGGERRRRWPEVKAFYPHRDGVHLSPFSRPSALDPFRGMYVRFAPGNREAVLTFLRERVGAPPPAGT